MKFNLGVVGVFINTLQVQLVLGSNSGWFAGRTVGICAGGL
jgi:hypothetical protein